MNKTYILSGILLILCLSIATNLHAQLNSSDTNERMQRFITQNLWDDVLLLASDMLIENPDEGLGYYYSALAFYRIGDIEKAREYLIYTDDFDDEQLKTDVFKLREDMDYNESLDQAASQIGNIQQSGATARAADEWRDLWTQDKSQIDFALNAVQLYVQQKRYVEALDILGDAALRTAPEANETIRIINNTPEMIAYNTYTNAMRDGRQNLSNGNYQQALSQFNTALRVRNNDTDASRLKREAEDELAWVATTTTHTITSYDAYLAGNTNKKYANEARNIIRNALIFHGRTNAENDNVQQTEYYLNRFLNEYPGDRDTAETTDLLCQLYIRVADKNASIKTVGAQRSASDYYTRAQRVCATPSGLESKITSTNRKATNWSHPSQAFMSFTYDELSTYGISIGNLNTRGAGFYFTVRANEFLFDNTDLYTIDNNGDIDGGFSSYTYQDAGGRRIINGEGLIGLTYELAYPLWLYAGAGAAYNADQWEIDEFLRGAFSETIWIRNTDQTKYEPVFEAGVILNYSGIHLRAGIKGYDRDRTFTTIGAGFSF